MTLAEQEELGGWQEEVLKLVDGCLDDVRNGHSQQPEQVICRLRQATELSKYVQDGQLAHVTLLQTSDERINAAVRKFAFEVLYDRVILELRSRPEYQQLLGENNGQEETR
jgi:hypothetical protein